MSSMSEVYMTQQREQESLKRNHESYEVEIEYRRQIAEIQVQVNAYEFIQKAIRETDNIKDIL